MLFNSIDFAIFLPIVFILYWFVTNRNIKLQNLLIVAASYFFYGCWDWRFLSLIIFSTIVDYSVGLWLANEEKQRKRKLLLLLSIFVNLGFLGFFKYYNFFLDNFIATFSLFGVGISAGSLNIVLPVGISFYTFQTMSYTIDVYNRKLEPTRDIISFAAFVSFFPQLVAGPIERATNLLPQFFKNRKFDYDTATDGMRQILWGLFKKVVIADNCAVYANEIFNNYTDYSGSTLLLGGIFFAFQIYGDFSGYSDIAIGSSRLLGFDLIRNFAYPYFSRDIAEFWRRWHISLSSWFRDYVYIPLGGSRGTKLKQIRNVMIIFTVSGFWHGANWTFIIWGALNALYFMPLMLRNKNRRNTDIVAEGKWVPGFREAFQMGLTFLLTVLAWIFFRAPNVTEALNYIYRIFSPSLISFPIVYIEQMALSGPVILFMIMLFIVIEWLQRDKQHGLQFSDAKIPIILRWLIYISVVILIVLNSGEQQEFIYFQF